MAIKLQDVVHAFFERKQELLGPNRVLGEKIGMGRTGVNLLMNKKHNRGFQLRHLDAYREHEELKASMLFSVLADLAWDLEKEERLAGGPLDPAVVGQMAREQQKKALESEPLGEFRAHAKLKQQSKSRRSRQDAGLLAAETKARYGKAKKRR